MTENKKSLSLSPDERKVPDESVVDKAIEQYGRPRVSLTAHRAAMRRSLEAVLPDLQRVMAGQIASIPGGCDCGCWDYQQMKALLVERDKEIEALAAALKERHRQNGYWRKNFEERGKFIEGMTKLLAERDKLVDDYAAAMRASDRRAQEAESLLVERSFPPDEIEALLEACRQYHALSHPLLSAWERLEKMRDDS